MKLQLLPSAWDDLAEGFWFYESQSVGLGDYFRESIIADIEQLKTTAGIHRQVCCDPNVARLTSRGIKPLLQLSKPKQASEFRTHRE